MGYFLQEDYTNAISYFEQALKESQKNSAIYYKLGESYYMRGSFHRGIQYLNKAIELDSDNLAYHLVLADIYISQQEYILAAEVYENMLEENPNAIELPTNPLPMIPIRFICYFPFYILLSNCLLFLSVANLTHLQFYYY